MKFQWKEDLEKYLVDNGISISVNPDDLSPSLWLVCSKGQSSLGHSHIGAPNRVFDESTEFLFYRQGNIADQFMDDLEQDEFEFSQPGQRVSDIRNYDDLYFGDVFILCEHKLMTDVEFLALYEDECGNVEDIGEPRPVSNSAKTRNVVYVGDNKFIPVEDLSKKAFKHLKGIAKIHQSLAIELSECVDFS